MGPGRACRRAGGPVRPQRWPLGSAGRCNARAGAGLGAGWRAPAWLQLLGTRRAALVLPAPTTGAPHAPLEWRGWQVARPEGMHVRGRVRSWPAGLAVMWRRDARRLVQHAQRRGVCPLHAGGALLLPSCACEQVWAGVVEEARARRVGVAGTERFACLAPRLACGATAPTGFKLMRAGRVRRTVVAVGETKLVRPHQRRGFRRVLKRGGAREVEQPERAVVQRRVRCCSVVLVGHDPRAERVAEVVEGNGW